MWRVGRTPGSWLDWNPPNSGLHKGKNQDCCSLQCIHLLAVPGALHASNNCLLNTPVYSMGGYWSHGGLHTMPHLVVLSVLVYGFVVMYLVLAYKSPIHWYCQSSLSPQVRPLTWAQGSLLHPVTPLKGWRAELLSSLLQLLNKVKDMWCDTDECIRKLQVGVECFKLGLSQTTRVIGPLCAEQGRKVSVGLESNRPEFKKHFHYLLRLWPRACCCTSWPQFSNLWNGDDGTLIPWGSHRKDCMSWCKTARHLTHRKQSTIFILLWVDWLWWTECFQLFLIHIRR